MTRSWGGGAVAAAVLLTLVAGCGASRSRGTAASSTPARTTSAAPSTPSTAPTGPLGSGPITGKDGSCPLVSRADMVSAAGMRLIRVVVLSQAGQPVGCDFYADPAFAASEHLPGPGQPAVSVRISRYATATAAFNAMARTAKKAGASAHEVDLSASLRGVAYRTRFDPPDGSQDWAYDFTSGTHLIQVLTAQTASELDAEDVGRALARTTFS